MVSRRGGWATSSSLSLRPGRADLLLVGAITALGLLLRLPSFGDSLFADELSTYFVVTGHSLGRVIYLLNGHSVDLNPPLSFVLAWLAEQFGSSPHLIALPSLLAGTAAIPLTYLLGRRTLGRAASLVGAAIVAFSPFLIFYSTEGRPYALLMMLVLLSSLALLRALDTGLNRWWAAYAACSCAALYTHYAAVFPLAAQFTWALAARRDARTAILAANGAAALGFIPWLPAFIKGTHSPGVAVPDFLTPFSLHAVRVDTGRLSIGHPFLMLNQVPGPGALILVLTGLVAALIGIVVGRRQPRRSPVHPPRRSQGGGSGRPSRELMLVAVLAVGTPAAIAFYSLVAPHTVWDTNKLITALPGLALLVGALVTSGAGPARPLAALLILSGFALGGARLLDRGYQRPDYQGAASFVDRYQGASAPVLDWPAPTPGPMTGLDVALAHTGSAAQRRRVALRVGLPSQQAILRAPPYAPVATPPAAAILGQAQAQAQAPAQGHILFAVTAGQPTEAQIQAAIATGPERRFHLSAQSTFPGLLPISVYVFSR